MLYYLITASEEECGPYATMQAARDVADLIPWLCPDRIEARELGTGRIVFNVDVNQTPMMGVCDAETRVARW